MAGPHAHDEKPDAEDAKKKKAEADAAKDDYAEEMKKKGATLPKDSSKMQKQTQDTNH